MASRATQTDTGIDPRIAELLGLDFTGDLDREDYISLLKEKMMAGRMSSSKLSSEETEVLTDEFRRVKKDTQKTFKVKKTQISAGAFKKQSSVAKVSRNQKALPGSAGGALVRSKPSKGGALVRQGGEDEREPGILEKILAGVNSILKTLKEDREFKKKLADQERKSAERKKRSAREDKLESGIFKNILKGAKKILKPVEGILSRILKFIGTVLIGKILMKIVEWMGDPENEGKLEAIGDFLKNTWPLLLAAYLLFGNSLSRFAIKLIASVVKFSAKLLRRLIPALLKGARRLGLKKSLAVTGLAVGGTMLLGRMMGGGQDDKQPTPGKDGAPGAPGADAKEPEEMSRGGVVPGSGNKDTVPAMLTPGEFVMSKGAVEKFGRGAMESMNAMGGGSGMPSFIDGMMFAKTGGHVPGSDEDKERPKFDPAAVSAMLSSRYGVDAQPTKPATITANSQAKKTGDTSGGGSLKGLSAQDYRDLAFIVSAEAQRGTDDEYGVAAAVLNRVADPAWPNTVKAVGSQAGQFEAVYKGLAKDDPQLAAKLASAEGQAKIVEALKMLKGRTDFKGTSQYGNMGKGDVKFSNRGNFYHYKEQVGKTDPPPSPLPTFYNKFIGSGGPAVSLDGTTASSGGASGPGGNRGGGSNAKKDSGGSLGGFKLLAEIMRIQSGLMSNNSPSTPAAKMGSKPTPPSPPSPPSTSPPKVTVADSAQQSGANQTPISETVSYVPAIPSAPKDTSKVTVLGLS